MKLPSFTPSSRLALAAGLTVICIWGVTFVNTKILLIDGMSPADVLIFRTLIAWVALFALVPRPLFAGSVREELAMLGMGALGGGIYFLTENMALLYTQASNVAFLTCTVPILTALTEMLLVRRVTVTGLFWGGSAAAMAGVAMISFSGATQLHLNPLGDSLALACSLSWALYTQVLRVMTQRYPIRFLTRKVLFYTLVTVFPVYALQARPCMPQDLTWPMAGHLVFLGLVAQTGALVLWNWAVSIMGGTRANTLIYLSPIVTLSVASAVLGERMTLLMLAGCAAILAGVWLCSKGHRRQ